MLILSIKNDVFYLIWNFYVIKLSGTCDAMLLRSSYSKSWSKLIRDERVMTLFSKINSEREAFASRAEIADERVITIESDHENQKDKFIVREKSIISINNFCCDIVFSKYLEWSPRNKFHSILFKISFYNEMKWNFFYFLS